MRLYDFLNGCVKLLLAGVLLLAGLYGAFALWDNRQVSMQTETQLEQQIQWKPKTDSGADLIRLQGVSRDAVGWITMEGTPIDFPVVQGDNNLTYLNRNLEGNFSLAGSIFLDCRNQPDFSDFCNLLYGHHMAREQMFGSLDRYRDPDFFATHRNGTLITGDGTYSLQVYGVLLVDAHDPAVFAPESWNGDLDMIRGEILQLDSAPVPEKILALSTCASDYSDARLVVLTAMEGGNL